MRDYEQVKENVYGGGEELVIDARPAEEFNKIIDENYNHIQNSINLPYTELFNEGGLKNREELEKG